MKKASEYRQHAQECRDLAAHMPSEADRAQLLTIAEQWERLANDRIALITRHPDFAETGEQEEERSWRLAHAAP
jgi:hypothetical protein